MAKPKSCKTCKWLLDFDYHTYTGKYCAIRFKDMPDYYVGTVHEKKDLIPCDRYEFEDGTPTNKEY